MFPITYFYFPTVRIIDDVGQDGFTNMAVDEALFQGVVRGNTPPTLRFYTFSPPAITIGYSQSIEEVDLETSEMCRIDVVRRPTGGRAVIHEGDLTFSLVARLEDPIFGGSLHETYRKVSELFSKALRQMGVEAHFVKHRSRISGLQSRSVHCFSSGARYELLVDGEKVFGCAQMRSEGSFLLQGSLRLEEPRRDFHPLIRKKVSPEYCGVAAPTETFVRAQPKARERAPGKNGFIFPRSLTSILGTKVEVKGIKLYVEENLGEGWERGDLSAREKQKVERLRERYVSSDWNFRL